MRWRKKARKIKIRHKELKKEIERKKEIYIERKREREREREREKERERYTNEDTDPRTYLFVCLVLLKPNYYPLYFVFHIFSTPSSGNIGK